MLIIFLTYLKSSYKPMRELSKLSNTISKAAIAFERIQEVMASESRVADLPTAGHAPPFKGQIDFDHVNFSYGADIQILKDVSFRIKPGQVVAIVGPSGTGKTTIASLIPRFFDPQGGSIKIDGFDIKQFTLKSLRDQISFVLQDNSAVQRNRLGQHRVRPARRRPDGHRQGRRNRARARLHHQHAAGLRDNGGRARGHDVGRAAPADRDRPRHRPQHADPDPRRTDDRARRRVVRRPSSRRSII